MKTLQDKVVVITGGTRNSGSGIAQSNIQVRGSVVIASRSLHSVEQKNAFMQISSKKVVRRF